MNGMDLTRRSAGKWIVDFGWTMSEGDAALYEEPFRLGAGAHPANARAKPPQSIIASTGGGTSSRGRACGKRSPSRSRYIATAQVSKHRLFVWSDVRICPDQQLIIVARDDDTTFGILHSRFHEIWSLRLGSRHTDRPRYTPDHYVRDVPVPARPGAGRAGDRVRFRSACYGCIALVARRLVELRDRWLNPPEWVEWVDEPVPGYPKRPVPRDEDAAKALKKRTLTNLYNARPQWLADAHDALDAAVASAYGWPAEIPEDEALR